MTFKTLKTTKLAKTLIAGIVVVGIASTSAIAPATAGGSLSISIAPTNAEEADAMRAGLQIYSIINSIQNGGIRQHGNNNRAGLRQNGGGNFGVVHQEGNGHNGTLNQNGNNNAYGLFQFGENTNANVNQHGNGQTGATFVFGWD